MNIRAFTSVILPVSAALVVFLNAAPAAQAQLTLTLTPNSQAGILPGTFEFSGILTNSTNSTIFLNGESPSFNGPATAEDTGPFDNNAPAFLAAGDSYTGGFLSLTLDPAAAPGTYAGTLAIIGGADGNATGVAASKDFFVTVLPSAQAVPEASSTVSLGLLLALGLGGVVVARRKAAPLV